MKKLTPKTLHDDLMALRREADDEAEEKKIEIYAYAVQAHSEEIINPLLDDLVEWLDQSRAAEAVEWIILLRQYIEILSSEEQRAAFWLAVDDESAELAESANLTPLSLVEDLQVLATGSTSDAERQMIESFAASVQVGDQSITAQLRDEMIVWRNQAIAQTATEWAVLLSHYIDALSAENQEQFWSSTFLPSTH